MTVRVQPLPVTLKTSIGLLLSTIYLCCIARADWTNAGGNTGRNGQLTHPGPSAATPLWSGRRPSIIAWQPVIEGNRLFMVRQTGFPPGGEPNGSPITAMNLQTGADLYPPINVPFNTGDWTTWIAGVRGGHLFAARSGNGASVSAKLYCYDAATGSQCWASTDLITAGAYDGVVFATNGDPIIASFTTIKRIRAIDGTTAWTAPRIGSVSGNCGAAVFGDGVYVIDAAPNVTQLLKRFDINTGAFQYASPRITGFTIQNSPFCGPDGTIYLSRTQNNVNTDFFYAFLDTGTSINIKWFVAANWSTSSEFTVGPDGSVYMLAPGYVIKRLNAFNGAVINTSAAIPIDSPGGNITPRMAADSQGRIFLSNGQFTTGRFYSFNADLTDRWSVPVANINIGAPAIGSDGTLIICGVGTDVRAYKTPQPLCVPDIAPPPNGNGVVNVDDLLLVINSWGACPPPCRPHCAADIAPTGGNCVVNVDDLLAVINAWGACP